MKNDIFNPGRFGKLLVADLRNYISEHSVNLIVFSLIGVAIFLIVGAFSIIFGTEWYSLGLGGRTTIMLITGFLFAITTPAKVYGKITDKRAGTMFLQLPASSLEKTLSMVVVSCIVAPFRFFAIWLVADMLICLAAPGAGDAIMLSSTQIKDFCIRALTETNSAANAMNIQLLSSWWIFVDDAIQNILYFLLGATIFKTAKTAKTFGCLMALGSVIGTVIMAVMVFKYADNFMEFVNTYGSKGINSIYGNGWIANHAILYDTISDTVVNLGLIALIWLRVKKIKH